MRCIAGSSLQWVKQIHQTMHRKTSPEPTGGRHLSLCGSCVVFYV